MRIVVLIFGVLGLLGSLFVSYRWGSEWLEIHDRMEKASKIVRSQRGDKSKGADDEAWLKDRDVLTMVLAAAIDPQNFQTAENLFYTRQRALPFVVVGNLFALIGIVVSFAGHGRSGAALLLASGLVPAVLEPKVLIFTGCLVLAGLFSLFIRPPRRKMVALED